MERQSTVSGTRLKMIRLDVHEPNIDLLDGIYDQSDRIWFEKMLSFTQPQLKYTS